MYDSYGDGWNGNEWMIPGFSTYLEVGAFGSAIFTALPSGPVYGCTDSAAFNYNPWATFDDGSCVAVVNGCLNELALNYNPDANTDDGSCIIEGCTDIEAFNYNEEATEDNGSCVAVVNGCMDEFACNYNSDANTDDSSCYSAEQYYDCNDVCLNDSDQDGVCDEIEVVGCTDSEAFNYNDEATDDNGSCVAVVNGCIDSSMSNYNTEANTDDGSCVSWEELANSLQSELDNVVIEDGVSQEDVDAAYLAGAASVDITSDNDELAAIAFADGVASVEIPECEEVATQNMPLDLPQGWSMFGYTCLESLDVVDAFSDISDNIEIVKDEWGLAYLPAWGFSAFETLEFGEGYQIKMMEEVTDFQFCSTITGYNTDLAVNPLLYGSWSYHSLYVLNTSTGEWEEVFYEYEGEVTSQIHISSENICFDEYCLGYNLPGNSNVLQAGSWFDHLSWIYSFGNEHIITGEEGNYLFLEDTFLNTDGTIDQSALYAHPNPHLWIYIQP